MNSKKVWIFSLAFLSCFLLTHNGQGQGEQCSTHTPTEYGKNLVAHMLQNPPHRWGGTTMGYGVRSDAWYWYGADIQFAANQWNNSSYKGHSLAERRVATSHPLDMALISPLRLIPLQPLFATRHNSDSGTGESPLCLRLQ